MAEKLPFITIVMATFNEEKNIADSLESVLSMEYPTEKFEVLIVDGGSTDGTLRIIKEIQKRSSNIIRIINVKRGKSLANNVGIRQACGEIIGGLDADDKFQDSHLLQKVADVYRRSEGQADVIMIRGHGIPANQSFLSKCIFLDQHVQESITKSQDELAYIYNEVFLRRGFLIEK